MTRHRFTVWFDTQGQDGHQVSASECVDALFRCGAQLRVGTVIRIDAPEHMLHLYLEGDAEQTE